MKLYVATSWKNPDYPSVVEYLKSHGHDVWDWRKPPTGGDGFAWGKTGLDFDPDNCSLDQLRQFYDTTQAWSGFASDMCGLQKCEAVVLLLPCGNSAHIEAGYAKGQGKWLYILRPAAAKADLMHLMADRIFDNVFDLLNVLARR